jgi:hypothetical protein
LVEAPIVLRKEKEDDVYIPSFIATMIACGVYPELVDGSLTYVFCDPIHL